MAVKRRRERPAQRRRTRQAIVDAAMALLARGGTPSVEEVAAAAEVSRRTVYMYFPTFDQLLIDATLGALSQAPVDLAIDAAASGPDVEQRVERLARALQRVSPEAERLGRELIRLTVTGNGRHAGPETPRRGYRRIQWIESALSPWRDRLDPADWRRLVAAIAMVVGFEALVVQRDVCGLSAADGEDLSAWAARAFLHATRQKLRARRPGTRPARSRGR
jgi:AcrR family transcriptional regulator